VRQDPIFSEYNPPADLGLEIVYRDGSLLVLNKPSGLLCVPGRGEHKRDSLATRVQARFPEALTVHRLDMTTSGLVVMARNSDVHRQMGRLFERREVEKVYVAVVEGRLEHAEGEIDLPLITDWPNRPRQKVDHELGKPSRTLYRVLGYDPSTDATRVELRPQTGRSHQLRVHMLAIGHPILGDELYANASARQKASRLLLHAVFLGFVHPVTGEPVCFTSDVPF
jgi:tRNA pseudouridine32 synthase/23S rRNA pseudouridine746 synthase